MPDFSLRICVIVAISLLALAVHADDLAPLEAYGSLPTVSLVALSPNGERFAYRRTSSEQDTVLVVSIDPPEIVSAFNVDKINPRYLYFISDEYLAVFASETRRDPLVRDAWEISASFLHEVATGEVRQLLRNSDKLFPAQSGVGRIVGKSADGKKVYMPAFLGGIGSDPRHGLLEVDLVRKRERVIASGSVDTTDWFVSEDGKPLAEEVFDNENNLHKIYSFVSGKRQLIYEKRTERPTFSIEGLTQDRRALYFATYGKNAEFTSYFQMQLDDGAISGPMFEREDASIDHALTDINRIVYGVRYQGFFPEYRMVDKALDARIRELQRTIDNTALSIESWTPGFEKLLLLVDGGWSSGEYLLAEASAGSKLRPVATSRPEINRAQVIRTAVTRFKATDGLLIPALVTARSDIRASGGAPLVVLPHGGPSAHDQFGFDWLAQYLASRGNVVLQPQFRGSTGFGRKLRVSGHGEWGGKMSTDLDDGIRALVADGLVDPERVCMVGASYGGYAALAAGAFSDYPYKCVVSIAGVSDLPRMLRGEQRERGSDHWIVAYWEEQVGSDKGDWSGLDAISPIAHVEDYRAPVLLIHGKDDIVVPYDQSNRMYKALKKAKKDVEFVKLKGEDHYLSQGETRLQTLRAIDEFLKKYL